MSITTIQFSSSVSPTLERVLAMPEPGVPSIIYSFCNLEESGLLLQVNKRTRAIFFAHLHLLCKPGHALTSIQTLMRTTTCILTFRPPQHLAVVPVDILSIATHPIMNTVAYKTGYHDHHVHRLLEEAYQTQLQKIGECVLPDMWTPRDEPSFFLKLLSRFRAPRLNTEWADWKKVHLADFDWNVSRTGDMMAILLVENCRKESLGLPVVNVAPLKDREQEMLLATIDGLRHLKFYQGLATRQENILKQNRYFFMDPDSFLRKFIPSLVVVGIFVCLGVVAGILAIALMIFSDINTRDKGKRIESLKKLDTHMLESTKRAILDFELRSTDHGIRDAVRKRVFGLLKFSDLA